MQTAEWQTECFNSRANLLFKLCHWQQTLAHMHSYMHTKNTHRYTHVTA